MTKFLLFIPSLAWWMNGSDTLIYCVEILLDFSLIFCVRYIYFGFLLKANVLLANPTLVISGKCILKERNKYITSFCCEVIFGKISTILSSAMLLLFKDFEWNCWSFSLLFFSRHIWKHVLLTFFVVLVLLIFNFFSRHLF